MNRTLIALILILLSFSSCAQRPLTADADADEALGVETENNAAQAQQELERIQKQQLEDQKRQLDRQITDPAQL